MLKFLFCIADIFQPDPDYEENEERYKTLYKEILGSDTEDSHDNDSDEDEEEDNSSNEDDTEEETVDDDSMLQL